MSRFSRIALAIGIAAFALLGLSFLTENIELPRALVRLLEVAPASGQPASTATPVKTTPAFSTTAAPITPTSPPATDTPLAATATPTGTATVSATTQTAPAPTTVPTHTLELLGPRSFRIDPANPSLDLWLTTSGQDLPRVTAGIFGLYAESDGTAWPAQLRSIQPVSVPAGVVTTLTLTLTEADGALPPFGRYNAALRLSSAPDKTETYSITLTLAPASSDELLVSVSSPIHVGESSQAIKFDVAARFKEARNVQARVTQLVDSASRSLPVGFITPSTPETVTTAPQTISLGVDAAGLRRTLGAGEAYTATLLVTADNAPAVQRELRLVVDESGARWKLETPRVAPAFSSDGPTATFDLWFTAQGGQAANAKPPELTLLTLTDAQGVSILGGAEPIEGKELGTQDAGLSQRGWTFTPTLAMEPLSQGVYSGTVRLAQSDAIQTLSFALEVPQRTLGRSLPTNASETPEVMLSFIRLFPCHVHDCFWSIGSRALYLAPEIGFDRLTGLAIPPANLVKPGGGLGQLMFATATPAPTTASAATAEANTPVLSGPAAMGWPVQMRLSNIGATGIYSGVTEIRSPDLASPVPLSIRVTVTDLIIWPFLFIALGIVASAWISRRLDPETNPDYLRLRNEELRKEIDRLAASTLSLEFMAETLKGNPDKRDNWPKDAQQAIERAQNLIKHSNENIGDRRLAEARADRAKAEQGLDKLRLFAEVLELWQRTTPLGKPEPIRDLLAKAWQHARQDEPEKAKNSINEARTKLDEAAKTAFQLEDAGDLGAAGSGLRELAQLSFAAGNYGMAYGLRQLANSAQDRSVSKPEYELRCLSPANGQRSGTPYLAGETLSFAVVEQTTGQLAPNSKYEWSLNNKPLDSCRGATCNHVLAIGAAKEHTITVKFTASDHAHTLEYPFTITQPELRIHITPDQRHAEERLYCQIERQTARNDFVPLQQDGLAFDWLVSVRERTGRYRRMTDTPHAGSTWSWTPAQPGEYRIECTVKVSEAANPENASISVPPNELSVSPSLLTLARRTYRKGQRWASVGTFIIASLAGVAYVVFVNPTFGSLQEYLLAFLWGAGVDQARRGMPAGVTAVLQRFTNWLSGKPNPNEETPPKPAANGGAPGESKNPGK